jgi:hypothetical protein
MIPDYAIKTMHRNYFVAGVEGGRKQEGRERNNKRVVRLRIKLV